MPARTRAIALALVLCGASLSAAQTKNIDKTLPLNAGGTVALDAHNGSIQIRTWDRADVDIHIQIEAHGTSVDARRRFDETTAEIDGSRDRISIRSKTPEWSLNSVWTWLISSGWDASPDIRYIVTAPRTARWAVRNHNAKVDIRDVNAALEVDMHNGDLLVANLAGPLAMQMHNGSARIDFASFTHNSRITTHNGRVEVALPASSRFDLHSSGHNMRVDSDFPAVLRASDFGRHTANGQVNGGGPELLLTSHNGSFRLKSK